MQGFSIRYQRLVQQCERSECYQTLFSLNTSPNKSAHDQPRWVFLPNIQDVYHDNNEFSWGTMCAIFSDSIFGMTFVSWYWYMKGNNLNACRRVFCFVFQPMDAFDLLITGRSHFLLSKRLLSFNNVMATPISTLLNSPQIRPFAKSQPNFRIKL